LLQPDLPTIEGASIFGDAKITMALLDRLTHHCRVLETRIDSLRFKNSAAQEHKKRRRNAGV